jgi:hypothetical protein
MAMTRTWLSSRVKSYVLPKAMRERLGWPGTELDVSSVGETMVLRAQPL